MEEADELCNRLAIIDHGKLLALGTPTELKASTGAATYVTVTASGDLDTLAPFLAEKVSGVTRAEQIDGKVLLFVDHADGVLPAVVTAAESGGYSITDLSIMEPTLESVFINLTGRELRE